jgi:hypothetical protein
MIKKLKEIATVNFSRIPRKISAAPMLHILLAIKIEDITLSW